MRGLAAGKKEAEVAIALPAGPDGTVAADRDLEPDDAGHCARLVLAAHLDPPGCEETFLGYGVGSLKARPELEWCLRHLRSATRLVVWRLDRLSCFLRHVVETIAKFEDHVAVA